LFGFSGSRDRLNRISFKKEPLPKVKGAALQTCNTDFYPACMGFILNWFSLAASHQPIFISGHFNEATYFFSK